MRDSRRGRGAGVGHLIGRRDFLGGSLALLLAPAALARDAELHAALGKSGLAHDLCRQLRSSLKTGSIPIIMLTAKTDLESEAEGLDAGADDYLMKPFEPQRLAVRVKALLARSRSKFTAQKTN